MSGRRDWRGNTWSWEAHASTEEKRPRRKIAWNNALLLSVAALLIAVGAALLILSITGGDGSSSAGVVPTRTRGGASSSAVASAVASPADESELVELYVWSRVRREWVDRLDQDGAGYAEGDAIPFMLRIDRARPEANYDIELLYQCNSADGAVIDYLSALAQPDAEAPIAEPGPERARGDSSIPIPDDPSIVFDDRAERRFQLWGATFEGLPEGPLPSGSCQTEKRVRAQVLALEDTLFLVWAGHLAREEDWGAGHGAASQKQPIYLEAQADSRGGVRAEIAPGGISP